MCDAIKEVFSMMVGVDIIVPDHTPPATHVEVTGIVGLAGELCGVLTVQCSKTCGAKIASHMLHVLESEAAEHMNDAIGEVCNMVAGNFKAKFAGLEDKCLLSVPTVITGGDYKVYPLVGGEGIQLSFQFEGQTAWVSLEIRS
jgi:chemotaxis protein CheX